MEGEGKGKVEMNENKITTTKTEIPLFFYEDGHKKHPPEKPGDVFGFV